MDMVKMIRILVLLSCLFLKIDRFNADVVPQWCPRTGYNNLCTSIIAADRRNNLKNSPNGLCTIIRDKAVATAAATTAKISDALKKTSQVYARQCLQQCSEGYARAISDLKSVDFTVLNRQNYQRQTTYISTAVVEPSDCEDCFKERPGTLPSPITAENANLVDIAAVILGIINLKECNKAAAC